MGEGRKWRIEKNCVKRGLWEDGESSSKAEQSRAEQSRWKARRSAGRSGAEAAQVHLWTREHASAKGSREPEKPSPEVWKQVKAPKLVS